MRQMFSIKQIQKMIEEGALTPEQIYELLVGKYVRIMDAPEGSADVSSFVLTDEQIEQISGGAFINGTFLGDKNPVLLPATGNETYISGLVLTQIYIRKYTINLSTKTIYFNSDMQFWFSGTGLRIYGLNQINNKTIPSYPANTGLFHFVCEDGTLKWLTDDIEVSFTAGTSASHTFSNVYASAVKNGNKLTLVISMDWERTDTGDNNPLIGSFTIPSDIASKIIPSSLGSVDNRLISLFESATQYITGCGSINKSSNTLNFIINARGNDVQSTVYHVRYEVTFLLSDNLAE